MFHPRSSIRLSILFAVALILSCAQSLRAQTEGWAPATTGFATEIRFWTTGGNTFAKVRLTFPTGGWRVDWGQVSREGDNFTANAKVERWTGIVTQAITHAENTYQLGPLSPGNYTFTFKSWGVTIRSEQFNPGLIAERWEPATLAGNRVGLRLWTLTNNTTLIKIELYFPDTGYRVLDWGTVSRSGNEFTVDINAERWTGDSRAQTVIADHDYELGVLSNGAYSLVIKMHGTTLKTQPFSINRTAAAPKLLTEGDSTRAIALDSVTWLRLFPLVTPHNFSADRMARVVLFLTDVDWSPDEGATHITAQVEDSEHAIHQLEIEYVGKVPGFDWLTQVIVRPPQGLKAGDAWVSVTVKGTPSNKASVTIKP
jgi:hypothetical protein